MQIQKTDGTNFGMPVICKPSYRELSDYMFNKLNYKQYLKFEDMIFSQRQNPIDMYISVVNKNGRKKMEAEVGSKTFRENFFNSGMSVIKKAVKFANKLNAEKIKNDELLKNFNRPTLN